MPISRLLFLSICAALSAQFENVRVFNSPYYNGEPSLAVSGAAIAVAYESYEYGNDEIMLALSTDNGASFSAPVRVTATDSSSWRPKVRLNSGCDLVWEDYLSGTRQVYYRRYEGASLGPQVRISGGNTYAAFPALCGKGADFYVSWEDSRDGNDEIYFRKYASGSWSAEKRLTVDDSTSWGADIALDTAAGVLYMVWFDYRTGNDEIYAMTSSDQGETWSAPVNLSNDSRNSWEPRVTALNGKAAVVWYSWRSDLSSYEVFYSQNTGSGWSAPEVVSSLGADSKCPSVSCSDSGAAVAWEDYGDGNDEIYTAFKSWSESSWRISRITWEAHDSFGADVLMAGESVYLTWFDYRDGVDQIYFAKGDAEAIPAEQRPSRGQPDIVFYPNPAHSQGTLTLEELSKRGGSGFLLADITGKVLHRFTDPGHSLLRLPVLPAGVYFLSSKNARPGFTSRRLIVR